MTPFLRMPPFPGRRLPAWEMAVPDAERGAAGAPGAAELADIARALRQARVGGAFWAARMVPPPGRQVLLAATTPDEARTLSGMAAAAGVNGWLVGGDAPADPWHLAEAVDAVWAVNPCDLTLVAQVLGRPVRLLNPGPGDALMGALAGALAGLAWRSPFTGAAIHVMEAIAILADWRRMIDANRTIVGIAGIARWKRETLNALLWNGVDVPYASARQARRMRAGEQALIWAARVPPGLAADLAAHDVRVGEIEDGFIRSSGLGANCVPPLSVVVDMLGSHVDPSRPSTLETLCQETDFSPALLARAAALRERLVAAGIGKYGAKPPSPGALSGESPDASSAVAVRPRRVLVCGQVEDDRAILLGGAGVTNLALLARARALEPDAELIWRPHPDVEAGHRKGAVPAEVALAHADRIERSRPIAALFTEVQAVHVISSLAGFEALLRGLTVAVHGLPFYAGWGLTQDLASVPARRGRRLTLDELVAAALILYPRYLDPVSRLPCGPELLITRMAAGDAEMASPLVTLRVILGKARKLITPRR